MRVVLLGLSLCLRTAKVMIFYFIDSVIVKASSGPRYVGWVPQ